MTGLGAASVQRLFPGTGVTRDLRGLYLEEPWRPNGTPSKPCVYADFIASLDGRIALPDRVTKTSKVPAAIANPRDWRLFQELAAAADVLVTTGRYVRDLAAGGAQAAVPVSTKPEFEDLLAWRRDRGLPEQPAIAIVSGHLDLPIPEPLLESRRPIYIATGATVDPSVAVDWSARRVHVLTLGRGTRVGGRELVDALTKEGFGNIDMIGGSVLLRTLLADNVLDRLYLTIACRMLGGRTFDTLLKGEQLEPPANFTVRSLCCDRDRGDAPEQLFAILDRSGQESRHALA